MQLKIVVSMAQVNLWSAFTLRNLHRQTYRECVVSFYVEYPTYRTQLAILGLDVMGKCFNNLASVYMLILGITLSLCCNTYQNIMIKHSICNHTSAWVTCIQNRSDLSI